MSIKEIIFPEDQQYRYYYMHYRYVMEIVKAAGISLKLSKKVKEIGGAQFEMRVDGIPVVVDFFNFTEVMPGHEQHPFYFKFHYTEGIHDNMEHLFPFGTISFYDWPRYRKLKQSIRYSTKGEMVLCNQRPYGGAVKRRRRIQHLLKKTYGQRADVELTPQEAFWKKMNNSLVSVCVPGARNDILDKGQFQYMAFGGCTISPQLPTMLPFLKKLEPGQHYVQCKDDYSDLIDVIEWCRANRETCLEIGKNAQSLFEETSEPEKLFHWIEKVIHA